MGSEGDVRPYIALALELKRNGHEVSIATSPYHGKIIKDFGIHYIPMKGYVANPPPSLFDGKMTRAIKASLEMMKQGYLEDLWQVCRGAEVLIYNIVAFPCFYIAEKLGIPSFGAFVQPHHPTAAFPDPSVTGGRPLGGIFNLAGFWLFSMLHWHYVRKPINQWREKTLQLPPLSIRDNVLRQMVRKKLHVLYAYSAAFLPKPADWRSDRLVVTGYWYLDTIRDYHPPPELNRFLNSGSPPVFISIMWNADKFNSKILHEISDSLEQRIIVHDLYGEMEGMASTEKLFYVKGSLPHEWLFKRVLAAVHHGGLGISMNCIRAGIPMITIPADTAGNDHRFWAYQITRSGAGVRLPVSKKSRLFVPRLISAVKSIIGNEGIRDRVAEMGRKMNAENGVQNAIRYINISLKWETKNVGELLS
jgi:UDP:flavonoid glycosyltransferase YjiC (YdhE family)